MVLSKICDKLCVGIGVGSAELVIEVDDGKYDANLGPQFEQQAKQRNRVGTSRNGSAYAVPGFQKRVFADIGEDGCGEGLHRNMVHLYLSMLFTSP
jgi:hypothetical protein